MIIAIQIELQEYIVIDWIELREYIVIHSIELHEYIVIIRSKKHTKRRCTSHNVWYKSTFSYVLWGT